MAIPINCPCGKILAAREADAGLKAICPNCGRRLRVPGAPRSSEVEDPQEQMRRAATRADAWMFAHQKQLIVATLLVGGGIIATLLGFHYANRDDPTPQKHNPAARLQESFAKHAAAIADADPTKWRTDFYSFARVASEIVSKNRDPRTYFENWDVSWTITFRRLEEREHIHFEEALPLLEDRHQILVWPKVAPDQLDYVETIEPGQRITVHGKIGPITSGRAHDREYTLIRPVDCVVEIARDEAPASPFDAPARTPGEGDAPVTAEPNDESSSTGESEKFEFPEFAPEE